MNNENKILADAIIQFDAKVRNVLADLSFKGLPGCRELLEKADEFGKELREKLHELLTAAAR